MEKPGTAGIAATPGQLTPAAIEWAARRKISRRTLEALNVRSGTVYQKPALFFAYPPGWKARFLAEKNFVAGNKFKAQFFNLDNVLSRKLDDVYIVEGELDAAALVEAGIPIEKVLSVPVGARITSGRSSVGYQYVLDGLEKGLHAAKRFIWCGDSDDAGKSLQRDLSRIVGVGRFWVVNWPEGTKDANDYLMTDGPEALRDLVLSGLTPLPITGLYRLSELPTPPMLRVWGTGFPWDDKIRLADRMLSVVTGHPGHGKTMLFGQIWYQIIKQNDLVACVASFETRAKPHIRRQLRSLYTGKLEIHMSTEEDNEADQWIDDHYLFIVHETDSPTLEWLLETAEAAVVRHGAKIIQIDPWNRLESARSHGENETEYVLRCLKSLYTFANDMNCHVQIVAHPAKMDSVRRAGVLPPLMEDIAGSKHWDNIPDQGFVVHRPKVFDDNGGRVTEAQLYHRKCRFDDLGYSCRVELNYDLATGSYVAL